MTCWIASEAGKEFEIRGEISTPQYPGVRSYARADSIHCPSWVVLPPWTGTVVYDCSSDEKVEKKLVFKNIDFTDDDSALDNDTDDIGQIEISFHRGTFTKKRSVKKKSTKSAKIRKVNGHTLCAHEGKVHERLKKGRCHQVGLGKEERDKEEQTAYKNQWAVDPAIVFVFNYTSMEHLRAMCIVPPMPSLPIPVAGPSDDQSLSADTRIKGLETELQRLRAELASLSSSRKQKSSSVNSENREEAPFYIVIDD